MSNIVSITGDPTASLPKLCDVPLMLRQLADQIEAGDYGDTKAPGFIIRCVAVLRVTGQAPTVFGWGATCDAAQSFCDLHAGATQILSMHGAERG